MKPLAGTRVLMILENSSYPGDGRPRRESLTLQRAGYQVSVIAPARPEQAYREVMDGVQVYRYRPRFSSGGVWGYLWEYGWALALTFFLSLRICWERGFDVIHAHNPPDIFALVALFYKPFGKKFVFDHHDLAPEMYSAHFGGGSRLMFRALVFFEKLSCKLADHIIATNESYKRMAMERSGVPAERITIVRNGPDLTRVKLADPDPVLRAKAPTIFGYVGVMGHQDGLDYLVRALRHLLYDLKRTDFYCLAIGEGIALDGLKRLAKELDVQDHILFTGFVEEEDLMRYLSTADIMVDPDPSNPFTDRSTMIKMMEYMALGKPIVAFDLPEHRVTAEGAALYAVANDEGEFASQLVRLMDDRQLRQEMGRRGRRRVESHLQWCHQEKCLLAAYEQIRRPQRSPAATTDPAGPKCVTEEHAEPAVSRVL
ncbi:MAG: glycosyltransferase family 4 protein [Planctomycetes bacterium]|nr:glycosyltransferase family 4 protein [Planctomycetota bacterium]